MGEEHWESPICFQTSYDGSHIRSTEIQGLTARGADGLLTSVASLLFQELRVEVERGSHANRTHHTTAGKDNLAVPRQRVLLVVFRFPEDSRCQTVVNLKSQPEKT